MNHLTKSIDDRHSVVATYVSVDARSDYEIADFRRSTRSLESSDGDSVFICKTTLIEHLELQTKYVHLMQMYESLLHSRDEYQKAADVLAAENKVLRESRSKPALNTEEILDDFCKQPHNTQYARVFEAGVRFAEKHHGIGGKE